MDIGKTNEDYTYYDGFEDCGEVTITTSDGKFPVYHIWEAYFTDIFDNPPLDGLGWHGFTRDCNEFTGVFDFYYEKDTDYIISNPKEYLDDILDHNGKKFRFEDTAEVYKIIVAMLRHAVENNVNIVMTYF